jgi:hypothetical protein
MNSTRTQARLAGLLYMLMAITAPFGLLYVPGKLVVRDDATATARNILASPLLLRLGIASNLVNAVLFIFIALALYRLLKGVSRQQATLMVILVLVQVPMAFLNEVNTLAALVLVRGAPFLSVFDPPQRNALALLFLRLHGQGIIVTELFWGLWLLPLGWLVIRSRFLPRILGLWLIVNGFAYVIVCLTGLLLPQQHEQVSRIALPFFFGEMAFALWLLIMGAKPQPLEAAA